MIRNGTVFVDTSAIFALIAENDESHSAAVAIWNNTLIAAAPLLLTSSYVIAETYDLLRKRIGLEAVRSADSFVRSYLDVVFVRQAEHERGVALMLSRRRRKLSLVDCVSFIVAKDAVVEAVFAFDRHFEDEAFTLL
jgi:predicted nucleic acid-binding protein